MISVNKGFWLYSFWYLLNQVIYSKDSFQRTPSQKQVACPVVKFRMTIQLSIISHLKCLSPESLYLKEQICQSFFCFSKPIFLHYCCIAKKVPITCYHMVAQQGRDYYVLQSSSC